MRVDFPSQKTYNVTPLRENKNNQTPKAVAFGAKIRYFRPVEYPKELASKVQQGQELIKMLMEQFKKIGDDSLTFFFRENLNHPATLKINPQVMAEKKDIPSLIERAKRYMREKDVIFYNNPANIEEAQKRLASEKDYIKIHPPGFNYGYDKDLTNDEFFQMFINDYKVKTPQDFIDTQDQAVSTLLDRTTFWDRSKEKISDFYSSERFTDPLF